MYLFDWFRSFLPLRNPIGFGAADFLELAVAVLLVICALIWNPAVEQIIVRFAGSTRRSMLALFLLPIALRLALLPHHPVPTPDIYDEFSHLLVADTLLHFRLANPPHPFHQFFETFFELQQPTYSSIYPIGQGALLAFGRLISGVPWTGVVICTGAFCALCYWMLRAWVSPGWALLGGVLAVIEFGPLNTWMNGYWGGMLAATAGCLVFGALPRLRNRVRLRDAILLGLGFAVHLLTRPFETSLLALSILLYFAPMLLRRSEWRRLIPVAAGASVAIVPALMITAVQNKAITQHWFELPYQLSQYQYGVPATLTIQANAVPHAPLTPQQAIDYRAQSLTHGDAGDTLSRFLLRLEYRVRYYRFFSLPPLYLAVIAFCFALRRRRYLWVVATLLIFALGTNLFPYLLVHYLAAVTCLFVLVSVVGLERLSALTFGGGRQGAAAARLIIYVSFAHFGLWYGIHLFETQAVSMPLMQFESWDAINHTNPEARIRVRKELAALPGKLLVFVRYYPQHLFQDEWVWNAADIDSARVVWARDLGPEEDQKLLRAYPDRMPLLLEPDFRPVRLSPYQPGISAQ